MTLLGQLQCVLYGNGLRNHSHLHGPISRMGNGVVGFENASVGINEVGMKMRMGFGLNEALMYGSHPESPHQLVAI